jgi:uncharacterized membrane protein
MPDKGTRSRVVAKAASWRVLATCDTVFLSWLFTGAIGTALRIGFSEVITKIVLFYLHERIWERLKFGYRNGKTGIVERHYRSVVKGISWRFFGTMDTILLAFLWTGDYTKAFAIGGAEVMTKVLLFWLHERLWLKVKWGKRPNGDNQNSSSNISNTEEKVA